MSPIRVMYSRRDIVYLLDPTDHRLIGWRAPTRADERLIPMTLGKELPIGEHTVA